MKPLAILALMALSACSARIHEGSTVWYDEGGRVDTYEMDARTPHRIAGTAISAATLYLKTGCVEPGATLVFHPPGHAQLQPASWYQYWAERIASSYPPKIAAWYLENWRETRTKSGAWAISMGARKCR